MPRAPTRGSDARDFDRRVRQVVAARLAGGPLDVHLVAESVRTSPRTLQRRLRGAGLTYARVVQQVRLEIARKMLLDPEQKIRDVARTLGYSDPAHFTRAFHRWTGLTPRRFRRQRREEAVGGSVPRARREPVRER
jgi:AraC-like DNA-binding protein